MSDLITSLKKEISDDIYDNDRILKHLCKNKHINVHALKCVLDNMTVNDYHYSFVELCKNESITVSLVNCFIKHNYKITEFTFHKLCSNISITLDLLNCFLDNGHYKESKMLYSNPSFTLNMLKCVLLHGYHDMFSSFRYFSYEMICIIAYNLPYMFNERFAKKILTRMGIFTTVTIPKYKNIEMENDFSLSETADGFNDKIINWPLYPKIDIHHDATGYDAFTERISCPANNTKNVFHSIYKKIFQRMLIAMQLLRYTIAGPLILEEIINLYFIIQRVTF
jgi:hypothetical protein